jgi:hypothetical protein
MLPKNALDPVLRPVMSASVTEPENDATNALLAIRLARLLSLMDQPAVNNSAMAEDPVETDKAVSVPVNADFDPSPPSPGPDSGEGCARDQVCPFPTGMTLSTPN